MDKAGAAAVAVGAGVVNGIGYTVQRRALLQTSTPYLRNPVWWAGFSLLLVAEGLGGVSFAVLPASVVVALGSCSVVANVVFASCINKETLTWRTLAGTACILMGTVYIAIVTPPVRELDSHEYARLLTSLPSIVFHVGVLCVLYFHRYDMNLYQLAFYAASVSSVTVVWFRPLLRVFLTQDWDAFRTFLPYASIAIVSVTGVFAAAYIEPMGLRRFRQTEWVPVHFVACVLAFGVAAEIVYRDWIQADVDAWSVVSLVSSLTLVVWGVSLVPAA